MKGALHALASLSSSSQLRRLAPSSLSRLLAARTRGGTVVLLPHPVGPPSQGAPTIFLMIIIISSPYKSNGCNPKHKGTYIYLQTLLFVLIFLFPEISIPQTVSNETYLFSPLGSLESWNPKGPFPIQRGKTSPVGADQRTGPRDQGGHATVDRRQHGCNENCDQTCV